MPPGEGKKRTNVTRCPSRAGSAVVPPWGRGGEAGGSPGLACGLARHGARWPDWFRLAGVCVSRMRAQPVQAWADRRAYRALSAERRAPTTAPRPKQRGGLKGQHPWSLVPSSPSGRAGEKITHMKSRTFSRLSPFRGSGHQQAYDAASRPPKRLSPWPVDSRVA